MKRRVSVIITTFNRPALAWEAVESVLARLCAQQSLHSEAWKAETARRHTHRGIALVRRIWRQDSDFLAANKSDVDHVDAACPRKLATRLFKQGKNTPASEALQEAEALDPAGSGPLAKMLSALTHAPLTSAAVTAFRRIRRSSRTHPP